VAGVNQKACTLSGDCGVGLQLQRQEHRAHELSPRRVQHGAEIYTQVLVRRVASVPAGAGSSSTGRSPPAARSSTRRMRFVEADLVVLAAGTLGSTEILLRSQKAAWRSRPRWAGTSRQRRRARLQLQQPTEADRRHPGGAIGDTFPRSGPAHGSDRPFVSSRTSTTAMVIEEGSIPGALAGVLPGSWPRPGLRRHRIPHGVAHRLKEGIREVESLVASHHGAMQNTQTYLVMATTVGPARCASTTTTNSSGLARRRGRGHLRQDRKGQLKAATRPLNGVFVKIPSRAATSAMSLISVHPLGGNAVMADTAGSGVVNDRGRSSRGPRGRPSTRVSM